MDEPDIAARLAAAGKGDMDAFAALFEELRPMVYEVACRLVGPSDADDVVMETYLKAWRAIPRFNRNAALKTWLYRVTYNCALDFLRARQRRRDRIQPLDGADSRDVGDFADERQARPGEQLERREQHQLVRQALDRLDAPHRQILLLRFTDGLSYAEIAAAAGLSLGTVMSRLFNAKRKLKRVLEQLEEES